MASWIPAVRFFRFAARAPQKTPIVAAIGVFHFSAEALNLSKPPLRYGDDANDLYRRVFKKLRFLMRADIQKGYRRRLHGFHKLKWCSELFLMRF